nr:hypothetical protein [uncultured Campylobacter sp.]
MKKTCYDLKFYDNGMIRGVLQDDIEALPFFDYWQKMSLCSTQGIYINENGKEHRLVYLHDRERFCRLFAREQELLKRVPAGSENERSEP